MEVKYIHLCNFMLHQETKIEFPEKGIVAVTGLNGHGKSALIEAVPAAIWNETLRGTPWYKKDTKSFVTATVAMKGSTLAVSRGYSAKGTLKLKVSGTDREYDSATKAQDMLNATFGTYETWRRTHVFSSADDAHLSRSTDSQRKRFMETILGLDKFDRAFKACREDLKKNNEALTRLKNEYQLFDTKQTYEKQRLDEALRGRAAFKVPDKALDVIVDTSSVASLRGDLRHLEARQTELQQAVARCEVELQHAKKDQKQLGGAKCPLCKQDIAIHLRDSLAAKANAAYIKLEQAKADVAHEISTIKAMIEEAQADIDAALKKQAKADEAKRNYANLQREKARLDKVVEDATAANAGFLLKRAECRGEIDRYDAEVAILQACDRILGIKGMRAGITAHALEGLEEIANHWLEHFTCNDEIPMVLSIKPYKELKRGGLSDEWSIDVDGAGGGFGYQATSSGQRQRIDVALLFASLHIAQAALGMFGGTTFFDEVFDHLDEAGVAAVAGALAELAEDRLVVVISHSAALVEALKPVLRLKVHMGAVEVL